MNRRPRWLSIEARMWVELVKSIERIKWDRNMTVTAVVGFATGAALMAAVIVVW